MKKLNCRVVITLFAAFVFTTFSTDIIAQEGKGDESLSTVESSIDPPANDACDDAIPISVGDVVAGTTIDATIEPIVHGIFCGSLVTTQGVWYVLQGTGSDVTLATCDSDYDTKIHVFGDGCGVLTCVDGNDDGGPGSPDCHTYSSELTIPTECGMTYHVLVSGFGGQTGNFNLTVTGGPDLCAPVPTMGEWGLIVLGLFLIIFGVIATRQRAVQLT